MRVRTRDSVRNVAEVMAMVENRIVFNGRTKRLLAEAQNMDEANALRFVFCKDSRLVFGDDMIFYGNLSNRFVMEAMQVLCRDGYIDLSGLKLQEKKNSIMEYMYDNGESEAYELRQSDGFGFLMGRDRATPCDECFDDGEALDWDSMQILSGNGG